MSQFYAAFSMLWTTLFNLLKGTNNLAVTYEKTTDIARVKVDTWYEEELAKSDAKVHKAKAKSKKAKDKADKE